MLVSAPRRSQVEEPIASREESRECGLLVVGIRDSSSQKGETSMRISDALLLTCSAAIWMVEPTYSAEIIKVTAVGSSI